MLFLVKQGSKPWRLPGRVACDYRGLDFPVAGVTYCFTPGTLSSTNLVPALPRPPADCLGSRILERGIICTIYPSLAGGRQASQPRRSRQGVANGPCVRSPPSRLRGIAASPCSPRSAGLQGRLVLTCLPCPASPSSHGSCNLCLPRAIALTKVRQVQWACLGEGQGAYDLVLGRGSHQGPPKAKLESMTR